MDELVSVIMPCYNDGAYIEESIANVWEQSYGNVELIVIDDGSDDAQTMQVLSRLDERCTLLHTNHGGPSAARNDGIAHARSGLL